MNVLRLLTGPPAFTRYALTILGLFTLATSVTADIKSATVDVNTLIIKYHVANRQISKMQAQRDAYETERKERLATLKEVENKLRAIFVKLRDKAMPKSERDNLQEEREELLSQYNALSKDIKEADDGQLKDINAQIATSTRSLLDEIHQVIHQYAKDNGYHWIIDTSGVSNTQISPLIYAKDAKDVTKDILAILNKDAPKEEMSSDNASTTEK